ncbi:hypothetical protein ABZP36_006236 [Zizania latifolia]
MNEWLLQSLLLAVAAVAVLQLVKGGVRPRLRTPPGPWKLPVIGSMHHLVNVLPHRALRDLAGVYGPLMMLQLGETALVVASSKEMACAVLKTHDANFANRPKLLAGEIVGYDWADIVFSPSGDYWRKLRQLCAAEILSPKRVLSFRYNRDDEVTMRVEEIRAGAAAAPSTPVNLSVLFHSMSNSIVSRAAFGKKRDNAPEFMAAIKAVVGLTSGFNIPDLFPTSGGAENVEENLVDVLLALQEKGGFGFHLDDNKIKAIILDIFSGGTGTAGSAMEWAMSELMLNPAVMKKLQGQIREAFHGKAIVTESDLQASNLRNLKLVIKEVLRLHPPVPLLVPRESISTCELEGYTIPAKSRVVVNAWAIGRDPKYWNDAEEFKPERFEDGTIDFMGNSYEFIPFGSGRRMCPGFNYGLASMELTLASLLYHFDWSLPDGVTVVDMEEAPGLGVRRRSPLLLCATPFVPAAASTA